MLFPIDQRRLRVLVAKEIGNLLIVVITIALKPLQNCIESRWGFLCKNFTGRGGKTEQQNNPKSVSPNPATSLHQFSPYPRSAICSVTICVKSAFFRPCSRALNSSTLLDQFMLQNFGPHMEQKAASL